MCCVRERWMLSKDLCCRYTSRMLAEGWLLSQKQQSAIPCRCFLSLLPLSLPDAPSSSSLICVTPRLKCKQVCLLLLTLFPPLFTWPNTIEAWCTLEAQIERAWIPESPRGKPTAPQKWKHCTSTCEQGIYSTVSTQ